MIINQPQSNLTTQSQEKEGKIKTMVITIIAYTYSAPGTTQGTLHSLSLLTLAQPYEESTIIILAYR